jgi:hypothetical protein
MSTAYVSRSCMPPTLPSVPAPSRFLVRPQLLTGLEALPIWSFLFLVASYWYELVQAKMSSNSLLIGRGSVKRISLPFVTLAILAFCAGAAGAPADVFASVTAAPRAAQDLSSPNQNSDGVVMLIGSDIDAPELHIIAPTGWISNTQTVLVTGEARDLGAAASGLDPNSVEFTYSTDAGATWSNWTSTPASFPPGSGGPEVITATVPFGVDAETAIREGQTRTLVRFRIRGLAGNGEETDVFPVLIDTIPPPVPGNLRSTTHQVGIVSSLSVIWTIWVPSVDASSGLSRHWVDWRHLGPADDCPAFPPAGAGSSAIGPPLPDGDRWHVCIWARDNAGNWAEKAAVAGPFWIDTSAPTVVRNLRSRSHSSVRWTNQPQVEMQWDVPIGGADYYAYVWDRNVATVPTTAMTTTNTIISSTLPSDHNTWYFHVVAVDRAGNLGRAAHYGPLGLDRTPPAALLIRQPASGWRTTLLTVQWVAALAGQDSPIGGYSYPWSENQIQLPDDLVDTLDTEASNSVPFNDGAIVYLTVKARDQAGNWGPYAIAGPYPVDGWTPTCRIGAPAGSETVIGGGGSYLSLLTDIALEIGIQESPSGAPVTVNVEYSRDINGPWTSWVHQQPPGVYALIGTQQDITYIFRCQARDAAGNGFPLNSRVCLQTRAIR